MLFPMIPLQLHDVCHVEVRAFAHAAVASLVRRLLLFAVVDAVQARAIVVFEAIVITKQDCVPCSLVCFFPVLQTWRENGNSKLYVHASPVHCRPWVSADCSHCPAAVCRGGVVWFKMRPGWGLCAIEVARADRASPVERPLVHLGGRTGLADYEKSVVSDVKLLPMLFEVN